MAKKDKKAKLPKRIAGVKIPKRVRKSPLGQLLASPMGQAIIVDSLVQAGRKIAGGAGDGDTAALRRFTDISGDRLKGAGKQAKHAAEEGAAQVSDGSARLAYAIGEAARSFMSALHEGPPDGRPEPHYETAWTVSDTPETSAPPSPARAKKKPARSSTTTPH